VKLFHQRKKTKQKEIMMATTKDLINAIVNDKPLDAKSAFDEVVGDKVAERIDDLRVQLAQTMFSQDTATQEE